MTKPKDFIDAWAKGKGFIGDLPRHNKSDLIKKMAKRNGWKIVKLKVSKLKRKDLINQRSNNGN